MRKNAGSVGAAIAAIAIAMTGMAAPANADDGAATSAGNPTPWLMPNLRGLILQNAIDEVLDVSGPVKLNFVFDDTKGNRDVINTTYWTVCWQSPKAGNPISQKSKYVGFGVKRLTDKNCYS
ncbi:hypothetical protein GR927_21900 [Mycolicibacterium sp. 3033]|nr:hypothetical protein [Mycolicibacterium aurantiacum]